MANRFTLPLTPAVAAWLQKCRWACGEKCFTDTCNHSENSTFEAILAQRLSRRSALRGAAGVALVLALGQAGLGRAEASNRGRLTFRPITLNTDDQVTVPDGYASQVVIRWGDPLHRWGPEFRLDSQSPEAQAQQFGYNADFVGFFPLPFRSTSAANGLLAVNHEYTNPELMFPNYREGDPEAWQVAVELEAHGVTIIEIMQRGRGNWVYIPGSRYNRRITGTTRIELTGPAAGSDWLKTSADPTGTIVYGTLNNCAGGKTPWGTLLTCEENFHQYFGNLDGLDATDPRVAIHKRYGLPSGRSERVWERFDRRFDIAREPNEPFRFGWVVEIDPYDPTFVPKKRTALGRFKHEAATVVINRDGRAVVYSGDDERFEYVYKFVSDGRFDPNNRQANFTLLDRGTLYVARFNPDGTGDWLPLVYGEGPLTEANGFTSQADVLINTRRAADLLGATKMDRPEDIETNPVNGRVYIVCTNNTRRNWNQIDPANPRGNNRHGHIIELIEADGDYAATRFTWEIFLLCGDPANPDDLVFAAGFDPSQISPISCPDNITFDAWGNMWIATDGQPGTFRRNDGIYAVPTSGSERGYVRMFLSGPRGCEICGPEFAPDFQTLFCAVQHPGEGGTLTQPVSSWPDGTVPRPSVVATWKTTGDPRIGS
ncbi:hypothetical protein HRbin28_01327 [bacterium HR28]|nr:hypothetical protein HRbin28_01327 [bacterium HR28]